MMANAGRRTVNYKPRMTDDEAYEVLPREIRNALKYAATDYGAYGVLLYYRKHGMKYTLNYIEYGNTHFCKKPWIGRGRYSIYGPCATGEVSMQR